MEAFLDQARAHFNFWIVIGLMMAGLFVVMSRGNLVKKVVGLNIFQTSVFLFYISMGKVEGGTAPILTGVPGTVYSNPLPSVLILTAIVVGVATTALGLALIVRIREAYGTIEDDELSAPGIGEEEADPGPPERRPESDAR
jgi:multicomponent Na+:H+ antiporter subunit C